MKRKTLLIPFLIATLLTVATAALVTTERQNSVYLFGTLLELRDAEGNEMEGAWIDGELYLPAKAVATAFGYTYEKRGENLYFSRELVPVGHLEEKSVEQPLNAHVISYMYLDESTSVFTLENIGVVLDYVDYQLDGEHNTFDVTVVIGKRAVDLDAYGLRMKEGVTEDDDPDMLPIKFIAYDMDNTNLPREIDSITLGAGKQAAGLHLNTEGVNHLRIVSEPVFEEIGLNQKTGEWLVEEVGVNANS